MRDREKGKEEEFGAGGLFTSEEKGKDEDYPDGCSAGSLERCDAKKGDFRGSIKSETKHYA